VPNASEVLSSAKLGNLVKELRERYSDRVVIFDLPPVLAADDVMTVLPRVDCVLMVVGSGVSTQSEVEEAMSRITRGNLLGVILNKDEALLMQCIGFDPAGIDTLVSCSGLTIDNVCAILLTMELAGHVTSLPGGFYQRNGKV